jgi:Taurine catabolism dioxygenase TauD, TfdA family
MIQALKAAPAVVRATSLGGSIHVEPLACSIGAELSNVNLGAAAEDDLLMAEIRALLLKPDNVRFGLDKSPGASHLLNYLISQAYIPEYQVRFRWKKNTVAFWDNRSTQHYAVMD